MANGTFHDDEIKAETAKSDANEPDDCRVVSLSRTSSILFLVPPQKVVPFLLATFPLSAERSQSGERNKRERPKEPSGVGKTKEYAARKFQKTNKEVKEKKEMIIKKI
jgi:hypothetical protein